MLLKLDLTGPQAGSRSSAVPAGAPAAPLGADSGEQSVHQQHCPAPAQTRTPRAYGQGPSQSLQQCRIRAQRRHVWRTPGLTEGTEKNSPQALSAQQPRQTFSDRIMNGVNCKKELNACCKQQREVNISDVKSGQATVVSVLSLSLSFTQFP